jgi:hypothetical protein
MTEQCREIEQLGSDAAYHAELATTLYVSAQHAAAATSATADVAAAPMADNPHIFGYDDLGPVQAPPRFTPPTLPPVAQPTPRPAEPSSRNGNRAKRASGTTAHRGNGT